MALLVNAGADPTLVAWEDFPSWLSLRRFCLLIWASLLTQEFKNHGLEPFDPSNEMFNPNEHDAKFEVQDPQKEAGTVAMLLKVRGC